MDKQFLTLKETAEALNVSVKTVRRLINKKLLRACRAVHKLLIPVDDVQTFIKRTC